jgi:GT2 family glycosyltransferase
VVVRADVIAGIGGLRSGYDGAQDHDLLLRVTDDLCAEDILHIPRVLYHWRVTPGSVSRTPQLAEQIKANIVAVVADHIGRHQLAAKVEIHSDPAAQARVFATRVRWLLPSPAPKMSIIIATRDRVDLLQPCVDSILDSLPLYPGDWEIVIVDNDSSEPTTRRYFEEVVSTARVRVVRFRGPFNWSAINNYGAREAAGELLVFVNNDTVVLTKDWCTELAANAMRTDIGAVGARLIYADGTIQHAGVLLGIEGVAGHEGVGETLVAGGYFGRSQLLRSAAAVTGACLATRRDIFEKTGGFDDLALKVAFNDVDYCMKVRQAGYRVIYNPFAVLYHLESKSRGREISEAQITRHRSEAIAFRARWGEAERIDPYYNPHFELYAKPFNRLRPPPGRLRPQPIEKDKTLTGG